MTSRNENETGPSAERAFSRRKFLTVGSAGVAGTVVTGRAVADTLADLPRREVGVPISRSTASDRGLFTSLCFRRRDRGSATSITPTDLHYERSHCNPDLDLAKHRLLVHGMTRKQLVYGR
jgi:sulfane dehydrogenase subunit SoxC